MHVHVYMYMYVYVYVYMYTALTLKFGEVCLGVFDAILIIPEVSGHAGEWLSTDQLTIFIKHRLT